MARGSGSAVSLAIEIVAEGDGAGALVVAATNRSPDPVTVIAHPRYFLVEVENQTKQFARASAVTGAGIAQAPASMPRAEDYRTLAPGARATVFRASIVRPASPAGDLIVGSHVFSAVSAGARARLTYQASDRIMPNLPRDKQRSFFAGPVDAISDRLPID